MREFKIGLRSQCHVENIIEHSRQWLLEKLKIFNVKNEDIRQIRYLALYDRHNLSPNIVWFVKSNDSCLNTETICAVIQNQGDYIVVNMDKSFHE